MTPPAVRVIVTRPEENAGPLVERLVALGFEPVSCPLVVLETIPEPATVDVAGYDWVIVTSRTGAAELARRAQGQLPRIAAIGPGTAAELAAHGLAVALVPEVSTQEGLVAAFPRPAGRVLFAGAEAARRIIVDQLNADFVALYRTVPAAPQAGLPAGDLVVVASPSAARVLGDAWSGAAGAAPAAPAARPLVVSIGPQTSLAARAAGLEVATEARHFDLDGLVEAIELAAALVLRRPAPGGRVL